MAKAKSSVATSEERWSAQVGTTTPKLAVFERADRDNIVHVRWYESGKPKVESLGLRVRDEKGKLSKGLVDQALAAADKRRSEIVSGVLSEKQKAAQTIAAAQVQKTQDLTVHAGLSMALKMDGSGMYAVETRDTREMIKAAAYIKSVLPADLTWVELVERHAQMIWRSILRRSGGRKTFVRSAERTVGLLYTVAAWLRRNMLIPKDAAIPPGYGERKGWRSTLKREFAAAHTLEAIKPKRPRYNESEVRAIVNVIVGGKADPRARLLFGLGFGYRGGQAHATMRSHLDLDPVGLYGAGRITIPGNATKPTLTQDMLPFQREAIEQAITTGHLRLLEQAYKAGERSDYPLMPIGRPSKKIGTEESPAYRADALEAPANRRTALRLLRSLEKTAVVTHVHGRGWHGLRRGAHKLLRKFTNDPTILMQAGGWTSLEAMLLYDLEDDEQVRRESAAEVRGKLWEELGLIATAPGDSGRSSGDMGGAPSNNGESSSTTGKGT